MEMLSCKQATRLMSQSQERPLGFGERFNLRLHTMICTGCRRTEQQFQFLRNACADWLKRME